jgi:starch-binding outer membrane protein, SusD/RagB family
MRIKEFSTLSLALAVLVTAGCEETVDVITPNVVEAASIDPLADQTTFARSAVQNMYTAFPHAVIVYGAWFTNEARVGDTFPTRNEFGRRIIDDSNGTLNADVWRPLSSAVASAENTIDLLRDVPDADRNINLVRSYFSAGFSLVFMAETFCQGVMRVGPPMTPVQVMDSAVVRFQRAITIGTANGSAEAMALVNASRVGLARAHLQAGRKAEAAAAAAQVPAGFTFNAIYADDPSNRYRLGNGVYFYSLGGLRESFVVGPEWREIAATDSRITFADGGKDAQDGVHRLFTQRKYPAWNSPIRLASRLEADYIAAEAGTVADQIALINARRTAAGQPLFTGTGAAVVLAELMRQRSIDFWLEGKRMGDFQRNGNAVPFIIQPGNNYYKPELGEVSNQTCFPVPRIEKDNNEHF